MIQSFLHRGLRDFFEKGSKAGIQPHHAGKLARQLRQLDAAIAPADMNVQGWKFHPLHDDLEGHFSVWVNGNWWLTFRFEGADAVLVDYQDYH